MQTHVMKLLGLEAPIFAFSHCRDVVATVSRTGGMGVLGRIRTYYKCFHHSPVVNWGSRDGVYYDVWLGYKSPTYMLCYLRG